MLVATANEKFAPNPIKAGWALDALLRLDEVRPGFLRFLHTASALRRQGVFLVMTRLESGRADEIAAWVGDGWRHDARSLREIAERLITMRVRDLIGAVFGSTPEGLIGALSRCGHDPLEQTTYTLLHAICDDPNNHARRILIRHVPKIDDRLIEVVWRLPKALLRPEVLNQIKRPEDIAQYVSAMRIIRRLHPSITDADFAASLPQMPAGSSLDRWVRRWIENAEHLPPSLPYAGDEELRPLVSAAEMMDVARRYQNCLRRLIGAVALGRACYYEHIGGAVAQLTALSNGQWLLDEIRGPRNNHASPAVVRSIRAKLEGAGVLVPVAQMQGSDEDAVADLLGIYEFAGGGSLSWDPKLIEVT